MIKKKNILIGLIIAVFVFIAVFSLKNNSTEVKIHPEISRMMQYLELDNCKITKLNNIKKVDKINIYNCEASKNEIDKYIYDQLEMYSTFQVDYSLRPIENDDNVNFSIIKYDGDKEVFSSDDEYLCVNNDNPSIISQSLIGHRKGDIIETFENIDGNKYRYIITVKNIGKVLIPELDDSFVRQHFEENNVIDYKENLKESLTNEHRNVAILKARDEVLNKLIEQCEFDLDKDQVIDYSMTVVNSYVNEAYLFDKELEEYYKENLNMSKKEFFNNCYKKGENYIKKMLVVGAIAEYNHYSVDETELLQAFKIQKRPDDETYTYMEYQFLTGDVTAPYIIDNKKITN